MDLLSNAKVILLIGDDKGFGYLDDRTPELSMAVRREYRNMGIGTKLIKAIAPAYRKIGVKQLSLSVDKANKWDANVLNQTVVSI